EAMNEKVPREDWVEGPDGKLRGPWQPANFLYLLDPVTGDRVTFVTGTVGGRIAIQELCDKVSWMRRLRGQNVHAVVLLTDAFMKTGLGGRQRPDFKIVRWVRLGGDGGEVEALPPPPSPTTTQSMPITQSVPVTQTSAQSDLPLKEVKEPSIQEDM